MRHAVVTGAGGFLGRNLVEHLLADGWRVTGTARTAASAERARSRYEEAAPVEVVVTDLGVEGALASSLPKGVDALFHVAGNSSFWPLARAQQHRDNVVATRHVVSAALSAGVGRLVFTSTAGAFGLHDAPIDETTPVTAASSCVHYIRTKALAEAEIRAGITRGLDAVIVNPSSIIGRYDERNWAKVFQQVQAGKIPGVAPGRTSFCHVAEVVRAHVASWERGRTGESYLLGGANASFVEAIGIVGRLLGKPVPERATPEWLVRALGRVALWASYVTRREPSLTPEGAEYLIRRNTVNGAKAERELGYRARELETMLADVHRWLLAERLLPS